METEDVDVTDKIDELKLPQTCSPVLSPIPSLDRYVLVKHFVLHKSITTAMLQLICNLFTTCKHILNILIQFITAFIKV